MSLDDFDSLYADSVKLAQDTKKGAKGAAKEEGDADAHPSASSPGTTTGSSG